MFSHSYCIVHFQSKGVRYYLDGEIKLHPNIVDVLKNSNRIYPLTHEDFDEKFIRQLLKAIFKKSELKKCAAASSLKALNAPELKFAKGILTLIYVVYDSIK